MFPFDAPNSYSKMLGRIGVFTGVISFICVLIIGKQSPSADHFLKFGTTVKVTAWGVEFAGVPLGYILIPVGIALISRILKLHDRVSDFLGIRRNYDVEHILIPLAKGVGLTVDNDLVRKLNDHRDDLMYKVFYPYAGYADPKIDENLVIMTLDALGWYWVFIEGAVCLGAAAVISLLLRENFACAGLSIAFVALVFFAIIFHGTCARNTAAEVREILNDPARCAVINGAISAL